MTTETQNLIELHDSSTNEQPKRDDDAKAWDDHVKDRARKKYRVRKRALAAILKMREQ